MSQSNSNPPAPPPRSRFSADEILCSLLLLAAAIFLAQLLPSFVARWSAARAYPFQIDEEEGFVLNQAMTLARGGSIYTPITARPWLAGTYTPLFPWVYSLFNGPNAELTSLGTGRSLVLGATLLATLLIAFIVARRTRRPALALLAPLLFIVSFEVYQWSAFARVDLPALALTLAGLAAFLTIASRWALVASALLFVAAAYTKQTALLAPLACALALLMNDRRRFLWFAAPGLAAALGLFAIIEARTGGEFFRHLVTYNENRMDWSGWRRLMINEIWFFHRWLLLALAVAALARAGLAMAHARKSKTITADADAEANADVGTAIHAAGGKKTPPHARHALDIYVVLTTLALLQYAKVGAAPNYVLEPLAAWALWTSDSLGKLLDAIALRPWIFGRAAVIVVAALLLAHAAYTNLHRDDGPPYIVRSATPSPGWNATGADVLRAARGAQGEIWSEEPIFTMLAGKSVIWQPFPMAQLTREGRAGDAPMAEMLRARRFSLFIVTADLEAGPGAFFDRFTPGVVSALNENYHPARFFTIPPGARAPYKTYYLWEPGK